MRNTKEAAKILIRRGREAELPTLTEGELGLTLDTNRLFIGNPEHLSCKAREEANKFPYGNVEIMTEFSDIADFMKYHYISNNTKKTYSPIIITGTNTAPVFPSGLSFSISNGTYTVTITLTQGYSNLETFINFVNNTLTSNGNVYARFTLNSSNLLTLIGIEEKITIRNISGSFLTIWGVSSTNNEYSETAADMPTRTIQSKMDDNFHIQDYGVEGHGGEDEAEDIREAIYDIYSSTQSYQYYRNIYFPAGTYLIGSKLPLIGNMVLKGEGINKTLIKAASTLSTPMFDTCDKNYVYSSSQYYPVSYSHPTSIVIKDMTIDGSNVSSTIINLVQLSYISDIIFENVRFVGNSSITSLVSTNVLNSDENNHITFKNCIFENATNGIFINKNCSYVTIDGCLFKSCDYAINIIPESSKTVYGVIANNNTFTSCGSTSNKIINLSQASSGTIEYAIITNCIFDKAVIERTGTIIPINSDYNTSGHNFTDILDPSTDVRKVLKFAFTQPEWAFVDYLVSNYGNVVTTNADSKTITNGLVFKTGNTSNSGQFTIQTSGVGDLSLATKDFNQIKLGESTNTTEDWLENKVYSTSSYVKYDGKFYKCILAHTSSSSITPLNTTYWTVLQSNVVLYKKLNTNNNAITNELGNITLSPIANSFITIVDNNTSTTYEDIIASEDSAVPTVKFIKDISNPNTKKNLTYANVQNQQLGGTSVLSGQVPFFNIKDIYASTVSFTNILVNVRFPYNKMSAYLDTTNIPNWAVGMKVYKGDILRVTEDTTELYYVCTKEHTTTQSADYETTLPDWNDEVAYVAGNIVRNNGYWWNCLVGNTGEEPQEGSSYWEETENESEQLWQEIFNTATNYDTSSTITVPDARYVSIVAKSNGSDGTIYRLNKPNSIDITALNDTTAYPVAVIGTSYAANTSVSYLDKIYTSASAVTLSSYADFYDETKWTRNYYKEGHQINIPFDRYVQILNASGQVTGTAETSEINFSDFTLYAVFYDSNLNIIPRITQYGLIFFQMNPIGDMVITISASLNDMNDISV